MARDMLVENAIQKAEIMLSEGITQTVKELLETKHLYQSIYAPRFEKLPVNENFEILKHYGTRRDIADIIIKSTIEEINKIYYGGSWEPIIKIQSPIFTYNPSRLFFVVPHVKLFCHKCNRIEAFNYVSGYDMLESSTVVMSEIHTNIEPNIQIFVFAFHCQSCRSVPEVFLIRREKNKLTLSGRSPIEHIEQQRVIPKSILKFFSDAVIAHQSGQTLAGVFLLRVLIEQWAQSQSKEKDQKADKAIDEYMDSLPVDFKARFTSFKSLYEKLSVDIHKATGSPELFEETRSAIIEHFEARRLYKL